MCHICGSLPSIKKKLPHGIVFVLILYFIGAIKISQWGTLEGTRRFAIERGISKEGRIKPARNAFTRKL